MVQIHLSQQYESCEVLASHSICKYTTRIGVSGQHMWLPTTRGEFKSHILVKASGRHRVLTCLISRLRWVQYPYFATTSIGVMANISDCLSDAKGSIPLQTAKAPRSIMVYYVCFVIRRCSSNLTQGSITKVTQGLRVLPLQGRSRKFESYLWYYS